MFTLFDRSTGVFKGCYAAPIADKDYYLDSNTSIWVGELDDSYMLINGTKFKIPAKPNQFCTFDPVTKTWIDDVQHCKESTVDSVNLLTHEKITQTLPQWRQLNLTAHAVEIIFNALLRLNLFTADELAALNNIDATWDGIKQLRDQSNIAVNAIATSTETGQITAVVNAYKSDLNGQ